VSSSSQMKVDYDMLSELEAHLTNALNVLGMDLESTATIAAHSGDPRLGLRIADFSTSWNKHRYDIKENLEWLRDSVKNIATQLSDVDKSLAQGLTAPAGSVPASPGGGGGNGSSKKAQ